MKSIKYIALGLVLSLSSHIIAQKESNVISEKIRSAKEQERQFKSIPAPLIVKSNYQNTKVSNELENVVYYDYDRTTIQEVFSNSSDYLSFQISDNKQDGVVWDLDLFEVDKSVYDNDISINNEGAYTGDLDKRKHYRGVVRGKETKSVVAISFFENEMMGVVSIEGMSNVNIAKIKGDKTHIVYKESDQLKSSNLNCTTVDDLSTTYDPAMLLKGGVNSKSANGDCVNIELTASTDIGGYFGNAAGVVNYLEGVFNVVATLYQNESIELRLQHKHIYLGGNQYEQGNSSSLLGEYQAQKSSINGDLSMVLNFKFNGGQAASTNSGLCHPFVSQRLACAGVSPSYSTFPTYSRTVKVIAHEFGHILGARHTHACVWNGNNTAIDGCSGFTEGSCGVPAIPSQGTIMSYCDTYSAAPVNFALGFGPQPGNVIRYSVAVAPCIVSCCILNRNIVTDIISGTNFDFEASNTITATNKLFNGATADYDAGNKIRLMSGFKASYGSTFNAFIDGCGGAKSGVNASTETIDEGDLSTATGFNIYPNPNNGEFTIAFEEADEIAVEVFNLMGKRVYTESRSNNKFNIDISDQPKGVYLVKINVDGTTFNERIIKN